LTKEEKEKYFAILEEKRTQNIDKTHILNTIFEKCKKVKVCPHCGATKCKIKITVTPDGFTFDPSWIRIWLEKIPDAELPLLGLSPERSRPEWMVLTKLPILPTTMRPSKRGESGEISVDGLTRKISKIIQFNRELQELRDSGSPHIIVEDKWIELNDEVKSYINSIKYRIENSIYNPREDNYLSDDEKAIQEEKNPLLKNVILTLLPYFDNKKAKEILIRSVSQGDIIERCNAARMLKYIRDNEIVKRLKDCLTTETDEKVKYYISNTINTTPTFNEKTLIDNTISNANISMETLSQLIINKQEQDILLKDDNIKKLSEKIYPNKECEIFDLIASIYLEKS